MKLPKLDRLIIEREKIADYLLNPTHRYGASKACFFGEFGFQREIDDISLSKRRPLPQSAIMFTNYVEENLAKPLRILFCQTERCLKHARFAFAFPVPLIKRVITKFGNIGKRSLGIWQLHFAAASTILISSALKS